ncbi:MAG: prenyltransferase/squalene oxidase repeat-containing protein, partial [Armatimonadota bacterium]
MHPGTPEDASKRAGRALRLVPVVVAAALVAVVGLVALGIHLRGQRRAQLASTPAGLETARAPGAEVIPLGAPQMAPDIDESLAKEAVHAIQIGVRWLEQNQQRPGGLADKIGARWPGQRDEDVGHWSDPSFPAMTGLAISAILRGQRVLGGGMYSPAASRGLRFITSCVQEDGGIYRHVEGIKGGGLPNYNTAICVLALVDTGGAAETPMVREARAFLGRGQHRGDDVFRGGMGYDADTNREYADVANTYFALEALRRTEPGGAKQKRSDVDWGAAVEFLSRCQHLGDFNDAAWVRDTPDEAGGFAYNPVSTKVEVEGQEFGPDTVLPAYGSATYAGISSYLNAGLDPDSPQVEAAL